LRLKAHPLSHYAHTYITKINGKERAKNSRIK
jgi:hypothetical protein